MADITPSSFASEAERALPVVVACTFDPLGLQGPLTVWLRRLTGLRASVQWIGYGMVLDALSDPRSAWNANDNGVNVLLMRLCDLLREPVAGITAAQAVDDVVAAVGSSCAARRGPTVVLLPPPDDGSGQGPVSAALCATLATRLRDVRGVRLLDEDALALALGRRHYCSFLDRVVHAPYAPAAMSVLACATVRELARTVAARRKVRHLERASPRPSRERHVAAATRPRRRRRSSASIATTRSGEVPWAS